MTRREDPETMLDRGAAVWNEWRAKHDETPDLSRAGLRGLDLSGFDRCEDARPVVRHIEQDGAITGQSGRAGSRRNLRRAY
jgi:hypothetical protein